MSDTTGAPRELTAESRKLVDALSWAATVYALSPFSPDAKTLRGKEKEEYVERRLMLRRDKENLVLEHIASLQSEVTRLTAERDAMRADSERLDELERLRLSGRLWITGRDSRHAITAIGLLKGATVSPMLSFREAADTSLADNQLER